jgi:hypothetical protein
MNGIQFVTVGNGTCFKPREYSRYINTGASVQVKEIFESKVEFQTKYDRVTQSRAIVQEVFVGSEHWPSGKKPKK